ncbi:MAG: hypothetical protein ACYC7J_01970 [Syntrophales bacterium]
MRPDRVWWGRLAAALLLVILIVTGCGKKGDPLPPRVSLPVVNDLAAGSGAEGVVLTWTIVPRTGGIGGFKILRSVTPRGADACPGCPQDHRRFRDVTLADPRLMREERGSFLYVDTAVEGGSYYSYRVAVCDGAGHCGEASNAGGVLHADR